MAASIISRAGHAVRQPEADDRAAALHQRAGGIGLAAPAGGHAVGDQPAERGQRRQRAVKTLPPVISSTMSTGLPPLASRSAAVNCFGSSSASAGSTVACAPSSSARARFSALEAVAMTRPAPQRRASWTASDADPAGAGDDDDRLALGQVGAGAQQVPGGRALQDDRQRLLVADAVGHRPGQPVVRGHLLGVAAAVEQADHPLAAADRRADELRARDQRQLLGGQVGVLDLVGVGVVDAGGARRRRAAGPRPAPGRGGRRRRGPRGRRSG